MLGTGQMLQKWPILQEALLLPSQRRTLSHLPHPCPASSSLVLTNSKITWLTSVTSYFISHLARSWSLQPLLALF